MKDINEIKEELARVNERIDEVFDLYVKGVYDETTFKAETVRLNSARNTLEWVLK